MDIVSIIAFGGIAMIVVGLLGGIEAEKIKIPKLPNWARLLTIITGVALLFLAIYIFPQSPFNPNNVTNIQATQSAFESTAVAFAGSPTQIVAVGGTPFSSNLVLAESTFDNDNEGWSMLGFGLNGITYNSSGGVSGGYIQIKDEDGDSYWVAPEEFTHDKSTAYGGALIFSLKTTLNSGNIFENSDVILIGANGVELTFNTHSVPRVTWTSYSIILSESAGWINQDTGQTASRDEILRVLSDLSELRIRGEFYRGSNDYGGLDNVIMLRQP